MSEQLEAWLERNDLEPLIKPSYLEVYTDTGWFKTLVVNKTVNVIDSIMGSGKTTFILNKLREDSQNAGMALTPPKFLVVVPLLEEVTRFKTMCPQLRFKEPQAIHGRKLLHLDNLIEDGENIVTTHSLFSMLNRDIYAKLQKHGYVLVIDEVLDCVDMFSSLKRKDLKLLFDTNMVLVDDTTKKLNWNYERYGDYSGRFDDIKKLCEIGSLVWVNGTALVWEFPSEFLTCFKEVYVLTYLFGGSPFYSYLKAEGFTININSIHNGKLYDWKTDGLILDIMKKERLKAHVKLYEGPMNDIGADTGKDNALSSSWFERKAKGDPKVLDKLKANLSNFFRNVAKTPSSENGWTSFGAVKTQLAGKGYSKGWIANNTKATNNFSHKRSMAYCCNWFFHPLIKTYFVSRGVGVNEDMHALSAMIQWVWRSSIRHPEPISLYIPSERMRTLFKDWLNGEEYLYGQA